LLHRRNAQSQEELVACPLPDIPKREGGELTDTALACLAAYADVTLVDKRTWEGVRRLRVAEFDQTPSVVGL
jgi:hypothetical protein